MPASEGVFMEVNYTTQHLVKIKYNMFLWDYACIRRVEQCILLRYIVCVEL